MERARALIETVQQGLEPASLVSEMTKAGGRVDVDLFVGPILSSFITQYDQKASSKVGYNAYALAQYFGAAERLRKELQSKKLLQQTDTASFEELKKILQAGRVFTRDFPPIKRLLKSIDEYLSSGKEPSIVPAKRAPSPPRQKDDWSKVPDNSAEVSAALKELESVLKVMTEGPGKLTDPARTPPAKETTDALMRVWKAAKVGYPKSRKTILDTLRNHLADARDHAKRMERGNIDHSEVMKARDIRDGLDLVRGKVSKLKGPPEIKEMKEGFSSSKMSPAQKRIYDGLSDAAKRLFHDLATYPKYKGGASTNDAKVELSKKGLAQLLGEDPGKPPIVVLTAPGKRMARDLVKESINEASKESIIWDALVKASDQSTGTWGGYVEVDDVLEVAKGVSKAAVKAQLEKWSTEGHVRRVVRTSATPQQVKFGFKQKVPAYAPISKNPPKTEGESMSARDMIDRVALGEDAFDVVKGSVTEQQEKFFIIVKGNAAQAKKAASDHEVDVLKVSRAGEGKDDTSGLEVTTDLNTLVKWLGEPPGKAPYPIGSLLWYRTSKGETL